MALTVTSRIRMSVAATIANNTIRRNHVGVAVQRSKNADIYSNVFGQGSYAAAFRESHDRGYRLEDIRFHHNALNGDALLGCSWAGVSCYRNS